MFCTLLTAVWIVRAQFSSKPFKPFELTAAEFIGFQPSVSDWFIQALPVSSSDPSEPNIAAYSIRPQSTAVYLVRLVHGYNMPMCMKLKYYTIEKIQDHKVREITDPKLQSVFRVAASFGEKRGDRKSLGAGKIDNLPIPFSYPFPVQLWRLTSSAGTVTIWATSMIRSGDFVPTEEDICGMAFPRVDISGDPGWIPQGFGWEDVRHPTVSFKRRFHSRWDGARWDLLTLLRLRGPSWASEELLSYITRSEAPDVTPENESTVTQELLLTHAAMLNELGHWRREKLPLDNRPK